MRLFDSTTLSNRALRIFLLAVSCLGFEARANTSDAIDYAVHGAAFSASVSYCHGKYGAVFESSPGGTCFIRAKNVLIEFDLKESASRIKKRCVEASALGKCITPELGGVVNSLLRQFDAKKI